MPWLLEELARSSEEAGHSDIGGVIFSPSVFQSSGQEDEE